MPSVPGGSPIALGRVNVDAAGTEETILKNFTAVDTEAERITAEYSGLVHSILIKAPAANVGIIYVGKPGMNTSTGAGVIADIAVGGSIVISHANANGLRLSDIVIDAANNDDGAYVSAIRL